MIPSVDHELCAWRIENAPRESRAAKAALFSIVTNNA